MSFTGEWIVSFRDTVGRWPTDDDMSAAEAEFHLSWRDEQFDAYADDKEHHGEEES